MNPHSLLQASTGGSHGLFEILANLKCYENTLLSHMSHVILHNSNFGVFEYLNEFHFLPKKRTPNPKERRLTMRDTTSAGKKHCSAIYRRRHRLTIIPHIHGHAYFQEFFQALMPRSHIIFSYWQLETVPQLSFTARLETHCDSNPR